MTVDNANIFGRRGKNPEALSHRIHGTPLDPTPSDMTFIPWHQLPEWVRAHVRSWLREELPGIRNVEYHWDIRLTNNGRFFRAKARRSRRRRYEAKDMIVFYPLSLLLKSTRVCQHGWAVGCPCPNCHKTTCKHPFIWPDGNCVDCGVLATMFPGKVEDYHKMLPRPLKMRFKHVRWDLIALYLKAHPEGVTGAKLRELTGVWQAQSSPTLKFRLKEMGLVLVGRPLVKGLPGNPKIYITKEI